MDYLQGESLRAAKKAEKKGDFLRAGDLYILAGDETRGMEMYLKGRDYAQAAKILEDREHYGAAAHCYAHAGDFGKAARLHLRLKDSERAAFFFEKAGEYVRASEVLARMGNFMKAAETAEKGNRPDRAAGLFARAGELARAADIYRDLSMRMGDDADTPGLMESQKNAIRRYAAAAAQVYFKIQDYENAAECYLRAGKILKAADSFRAAQRFEKAAELYIQGEEYHTASQLLEARGKFARASQMAEKAERIERAAELAERAEQPSRAADLYAKAGKTEKAADLYFRLLLDSMNQGTATDRLLAQRCAALWFQLQQYPKAAWCYERAGDPARAAECYTRGGIHEKAAEMYAAARDFTRALESMSKAGEVRNKPLVAEIYDQTGRNAEAAELFLELEQPERAAQAFEKAGSYLRAALLYEELARFDRAAALMEKSNELRRAAQLHEQAGQYAQAASIFESLEDLESAARCAVQTQDRVYAAQLLIRQGKSQEAITILQNVPSRDPRYREACRLLGEQFALMGMDSLARQKLTQAVEGESVQRDNVEAHYSLAVLLEKTGEAPRAREIYEKILAVRFDFRDVLDRVKALQKPAPAPVPPAAPPLPRSSDVPRAEPPAHEPVGASMVLNVATQVVSGGTRIREYEILEEIGKGATSRVYRARHMYLRTERAIKVIRRSMLAAGAVDRFVREARILGSLQHPNLVQLYEFGTLDNGAFFMVLELVRGESVAARVAKSGRIALPDAVRIAREAASGLQAAHESGIIHRDVSPDNLILASAADGKETTKVVDFGIAKQLVDEATNMLSTVAFLGKPQYSSPEQCGFLKEGETIDGRADVYSLAVTLHFMAGGSLPFSCPTPQGYLVKHLTGQPAPLSSVLPECPEGLSRVLLRALSPERDQRPASMRDFIAEIDAAV